MILRAWRITKSKHAAGAFNGLAAKAFGGRWNSPGTAVVYAAGSVSLAMLEVLIHLQTQDLLDRYIVHEVAFDSRDMTTLEARDLPKHWRRSPAPRATQKIGDQWAAARASAVLRVPSAVVPEEWNFLFNPAHPGFAKLVIGPRQPIRFDPRLFKGQAR